MMEYFKGETLFLEIGWHHERIVPCDSLFLLFKMRYPLRQNKKEKEHGIWKFWWTICPRTDIKGG